MGEVAIFLNNATKKFINVLVFAGYDQICFNGVG